MAAKLIISLQVLLNRRRSSPEVGLTMRTTDTQVQFVHFTAFTCIKRMLKEYISISGF